MENTLGKMDAQLKQWSVDLDAMLGKADSEGDEAKAEHRRRIDELKVKHQQLQGKLDTLKAQRREKWADFKVGVEGAWNELEAAFKNLTS